MAVGGQILGGIVASAVSEKNYPEPRWLKIGVRFHGNDSGAGEHLKHFESSFLPADWT